VTKRARIATQSTTSLFFMAAYSLRWVLVHDAREPAWLFGFPDIT
jgi:hypothetical protein